MVLHAHLVFGFKAKQGAYRLPILFWRKVVLHLSISPVSLVLRTYNTTAVVVVPYRRRGL